MQPLDSRPAPIDDQIMLQASNLREWVGDEVRDATGTKVGQLQDVYFDIETDEPAFLVVKAGWMGRQLIFVPVEGVRPGRAYLQVNRPKSALDGAPVMPPGGELAPQHEANIYGYYGLDYSPSVSGRRLVRR
jgi:sporulation protein YlmC with PRC-barrel domain